MNISEQILHELFKIRDEKRVDLMDAMEIFCEEKDQDVEVVIETLDAHVIELLRRDAIESRRFIPKHKTSRLRIKTVR